MGELRGTGATPKERIGVEVVLHPICELFHICEYESLEADKLGD